MKTFFLWLSCIFFTTSIQSQNSLQGQISNIINNEPLPFVNIYFPQIEKGTTSDLNGNFVITNLPSGNYDIVFSFLGFETYSLSITLPTEELLIIKLNPSVIEMEEVILSTPFHKLQSDNVMKVEQQKIADIKAKGAINLANGISNIAGVENISTGIGIGKPVIRGLSSNRVLVYTQGVRLENQQFGDEHGLGISDSGIESVEVIKGPASLLYGSDALGGVLYLNPERFVAQDSTAADASFNYFTNTQGFNSNLGYKSSTNDFKFIFRGSLSEHADYKTSSLRVTNSRFKEKDFKAGIGYQRSNFKSELRYNVNTSKLGIPEEIGIQSTNVSPLLPNQEITNHIFSSKSTLFFNNSSLDANFGFIYNDRKEFEDHEHSEEEEEEEEEEDEILEPALHMKLKTFNYDFKYNLPRLGRFETILGIQGMVQSNTNYGEETLIPDASTNDIGVLATSHIHFETIDIQLGARYDNRTIHISNAINKNFKSFNGALGAKVNLTENIIARLNLASGFRAPNLAELTSDGTHEGTNRYEIGNANLKNEQNFQADLSLEYKTEHLEIFANAFYNKINNYIFIAPNGEFIAGDPVYLYLQDDANLYGGEFGVHIHPFSFDWLHFESSFETVTGKQNNNYLPLIPANKLSNVIRVEFENAWLKKGYGFFRLSTLLDQNNISAFETATPGYNLLSAGFGGLFKWSQHELSVSISGNNLTNKNYVNHLSRLKSDGINNIGRNISLGFTYKI